MSNNSSIIYPLESPEANVRLVVFIGSLVLGTLGGCSVLAVIFTKRGSKTDNDIFITNLAVSDMTTIWFYVGVHFYLFSGHLRGKHFCRHVWPLMSVPLCASIFTITSMAVARCRSILFMWTQPISQKTTKIWVLGIWVAAIVVFIPALVVAKSAKRYCFLNWSTINERRVYTIFLFSIQYLIPLVLVLCSYVGIAINLTKYEGQVQRQNIRNENRDIIKALAVIVLLFAILLMPLQVGQMMWEFGELATKKFVLTFMNYADILCIFHSCLNPFIYGMIPREFRHRYFKWVVTIFRQIIGNCNPQTSSLKLTEQGRNTDNGVNRTSDEVL